MMDISTEVDSYDQKVNRWLVFFGTIVIFGLLGLSATIVFSFMDQRVVYEQQEQAYTMLFIAVLVAFLAFLEVLLFFKVRKKKEIYLEQFSK